MTSLCLRRPACFARLRTRLLAWSLTLGLLPAGALPIAAGASPLVSAALSASAPTSPPAPAAEGAPRAVRTPSGVSIDAADGSARLRIEVVTPDVVRVRWTAEADFLGNGTIVCVPRAEADVPFTLADDPATGCITLSTEALALTVDVRAGGAIAYRDAATGRLLLSEPPHPRAAEYVPTERVTYDAATRRTLRTADGEKEAVDVLRRDTVGHTWRFTNAFAWQDGESLYGLGAHMEDYMDLRHRRLYLCQHNLKAMVPVLVSTEGYGLLFDAGCSMIFADDGAPFDSPSADAAASAARSGLRLEAAREVDYYFMYGAGEGLDGVVARYRTLTGRVPMQPRYAFGYVQSKERYASQQELIDVVREYRRRHVPLDLIVQDWNYWPQGWGYMKMDPRYYPDPAALADSIHALGARLMVSIWPNPQYCPQADDFARRGFMLPRSVYDAYNPLARRYYWQTAEGEFFGRGFDAWWCDCSEPLDADWGPMPEGYGWDSHRERWEANTALLAEVLGPERAATFSLHHAQGIYEGQRSATDRKRVVNLTRSSYAGQQRYATITWNGDTYASWASFRRQIPAGLNFMATGCNYWTMDAGAFFTGSDGRWFRRGDFPRGVADEAYRTFYVRMLQWATFLPMMRSHGTDTPREVWRFGEPGTAHYDAILSMIRLRYRLLPYIYSLAGAVTQRHYTMARLLAFDFPHDRAARDVRDQYMFGPALLVCPVTDTASVRPVYLPAGAEWIDCWTGRRHAGGQTVEAPAPLDRLPLYVRAGSILPLGPVAETADQAAAIAALELHVYAGADADFTLYDDAGDGYDYEQGRFATTALHWDDARCRLTLGARQGAYPGMPAERDVRIVVHNADGTRSEAQVRYDGTERTVSKMKKTQSDNQQHPL